jgi:arsenate reductase (glutaredoxin)
MALQVFGTRKCQDTKKAERFFKERGVRYQFIDLSEKGMSPGELASVASALGVESLVDTASARYVERGLAHLDCDLAEELLADYRLMRTPVVRNGRRAAVGYAPEAWAALADG